ncbi:MULTISPECIES: guanylate-binding protein, partial [unclassified Prochlorococcus]|uniref:guanylate-binding protein n=3 Tax=Prochlorococcus TaxID=1218 RepID=UPI001F4CB606
MVLTTYLVRSHNPSASNCRGLELNDMYSLFDEVFNAPFGYTIPRDRVVVIPDSEYKAAQERQNAQLVARLEARRAEHLSVVDQLGKQIAELQPALSEAEPDKELAASKE